MSYQNGSPAVRLGRYELLGRLATGGMAEIHLARLAGEAGFEKIVVVKRLLPELVASRAYVEMFLGEAKLVARLSHPNICEVFELGREGAEYFLVMPFLDGVPATELVARPRDPDRIAQLRVACGVVAQACAGLHHAHELRDERGALAGLVHRDVSPSNVFVTSAGAVKVLDFGIAKVAGGAETEVGTVKGKAQYMAPEQLLGDALDRRADIFGLGIVLYELATHQRLFKRASDYATAKAILEEPIPRADASDPAIPEALADAIEKALAREPGQRFATARELADAIAAAMAAHGGVATPAEIAGALVAQHAEELTAQRTRQIQIVDEARERTTGVFGDAKPAPPPSPVRRRAALFALAGAAVLGLGAVAVTHPWSSSRDDTPATITAAAPPSPPPIDAALPIVAPTAPAAPPPDAALPAITAIVPIMPLAPPHVASPAAPPVRAHGWLSIDSTPFAEIFVDDRSLGVTPIVHRSLPAGPHRVRAVLRDGRSQDLRVTIAADKPTAPIHVAW